MNSYIGFIKNRKITGFVLMGFLLCIAHSNISAQNWYFRAGLGYAVPQASQSVDGTGTPYSGTSSNFIVDSVRYTSYKFSKISFTSGTHISLAGGYMFNKNVGIDLSVSFGVSMTKYTFNDNNISYGGVPSNGQIIQQSHSPIMLMPSLIVQSGGKKVNIYTRSGLVIPLRTSIQQEQVFTTLPGAGATEIDDYSFQLKNSFSIGFTAAAGAQLKINDRVKFYCEASLLSLSVYIKEADMTNVTANGQAGYTTSGGQYISYLSTIPANEQKTIFSNNFTSATNDPYHLPSFAQPFSHLALNVGLIFSLNKKVDNHKQNLQEKKYKDEDHINIINNF